jgi:hypothetical protein
MVTAENLVCYKTRREEIKTSNTNENHKQTVCVVRQYDLEKWRMYNKFHNVELGP